MSLAETHLIQARKNEELVLFFERNCVTHVFFNWSFVALYYAAYQYFCAFLVDKGVDLPDAHKTRGQSQGDLDMSDKLFTQKNSISHSAVDDYKQLFNWSHDVRYRPEREKLLGAKDFNLAINFLRGIKLIVFNETELRPVNRKSGLVVEKVTDDFLRKAYSDYKAGLVGAVAMPQPKARVNSKS